MWSKIIRRFHCLSINSSGVRASSARSSRIWMSTNSIGRSTTASGAMICPVCRNELGIETLRYAFPWHLIESQRGRFDWSFADQRIKECNRLGLTLMLDVMHFGTPLWLKQAVGDPEFPKRWNLLRTRSSSDIAIRCGCGARLTSRWSAHCSAATSASGRPTNASGAGICRC